MKKVVVLLLFILMCIIFLMVMRLNNRQVSERPGGVVPPQEQKGVLPKEQAVLDWLKAEGCDVEIPESHASLYRVYEEGGVSYDKYYEITWNVEFVDVAPAMQPGDPTPPRPNAYMRFPRFYTWDSAKNSYAELAKIKSDFQKDVAGGFFIR